MTSSFALRCPKCGGTDVRYDPKNWLYQCFSDRKCRWIGQEEHLVVEGTTFDQLVKDVDEGKFKIEIINYGSPEWEQEQKERDERKRNISTVLAIIRAAQSREDIKKICDALNETFNHESVGNVALELGLSFSVNTEKESLIKLIARYINDRIVSTLRPTATNAYNPNVVSQKIRPANRKNVDIMVAAIKSVTSLHDIETVNKVMCATFNSAELRDVHRRLFIGRVASLILTDEDLIEEIRTHMLGIINQQA